jgi:hypothetical protein
MLYKGSAQPSAACLPSVRPLLSTKRQRALRYDHYLVVRRMRWSMLGTIFGVAVGQLALQVIALKLPQCQPFCNY